MDEKIQAKLMAERALDVPYADPDDDLRTISRQFLRALEREAALSAAPAPADALEKFANTPFCRECGFEQCQCSKFAKLLIEDKTDAMPCWGALKRLHEIAATSDEETGPALAEIADSIHEYISKTKPAAPARDGVREAATEEAIRKVYDKWSGWIPYGHGAMLMADLRSLAAAKEQADGQ